MCAPTLTEGYYHFKGCGAMSQSLAEALAARRPRRADARRNFDSILAAAGQAFAERGTDVPLEDIAQRAGVGIATLYRHFPSRLDLLECAYMTAMDEVVRYADTLDGADPGAALIAWLRRFAASTATKHLLGPLLTRASPAYQPSRAAIYGVAEPMFERARDAGAVRADVDADVVMRLVLAATGGTYVDDTQRELALQVVLDGIRPEASAHGPSRPAR